MLERAGFTDAKIDRRSLEDQGIDRIPQTHEGKASKNAEALQSLLAKDFKKAYRDDNEDKSDDEEEGSGEESSSSSTSSGGGSAHNLQSKVREDDKGRKIDYPTIDKKQTRTTFNDEIKALNEKRAAFGDKPLKEQIKQLDRLMERLDKRVIKLQALESKTSLKSAIQQSISKAVKLASDLLANRKEARVATKLTAEEKKVRKERQVMRYGRDYREGLHYQIKEMKHNMELVEAKKDAFRNYKSFVDTIDRDLKKHTSITLPKIKEQDQPKRQITDKEISLQLHLKAEMMRTQVPSEFSPEANTKGRQNTLNNSAAINKVLQTKSEPFRIDKAASKAPATKIEVQLDKPIKESEMPKSEGRKNWFIQSSNKMKLFTQSVNKQLDEMYTKETFAPNKTPASTGTMKDIFGRPPEKKITTAECLANFKTKAEEMRENVPERHRGKSYDDATDYSFNKASKPEEKPKQPNFKLNKQFNANSGTKGHSHTQPQPSPKA